MDVVDVGWECEDLRPWRCSLFYGTMYNIYICPSRRARMNKGPWYVLAYGEHVDSISSVAVVLREPELAVSAEERRRTLEARVPLYRG